MREIRVFLALLACAAFSASGTATGVATVDRNHPGEIESIAQTGGSSEYETLEALVDTSLGQIVIEFFPKEAPAHVEYFIKKAREGAYDGTTFHRVVKYALIQGGD